MSKSNSTLTQDRLKELLEYNPETGEFTRKTEWRCGKNKSAIRARIGDVAGCIGSDGYVLMRLDGVLHKAHRLAWLYMIGCWPRGDIDHISGVRSQNNWSNLRDVDASTNTQNLQGPHADSASGVLGVSWSKKELKWVAQICINGKQRRIGRFDSIDQARMAYIDAKRELHNGYTG